MADDFSVGTTPADEITKDLSVLKNVSDLSQLPKEDREKAEKIVKNLLDSLLSGKDITPDKARENKDILKDLAGKGLDSAKQAMEKVEEQTNKSRMNFDESNFSPLEAKSHGHLKETIKKYEEQLKSADYTNLEFLNSTISTYRNIYYDLINIAKELESRSKEKINAA